MTTIGENIKKRRKELGWTQEELASRMGYKTKSSINKIELGKNDIPQSKIIQFAEVLMTTAPALMGWDDDKTDTRTKVEAIQIPVYSKIPAGIPMESIEDIIDIEEIPASWQGEYAGMRVVGDSMSPRIMDGDYIIVRYQPDADSGDIVVAKINGTDSTCKRLIKYENSIVLQPLNPAYEPLIFTREECETLPVTIWGKVVENRAKL